MTQRQASCSSSLRASPCPNARAAPGRFPGRKGINPEKTHRVRFHPPGRASHAHAVAVSWEDSREVEARLRLKPVPAGTGDTETGDGTAESSDQSQSNQSRNVSFVDFFRQASPYIANHRGAVHVVVVPGSVMVHEDRGILEGIVQDVQMLNSLGVRVVLVLGSNDQVNAMSKKRNVPIDVVDGYRVTSPESLEIAMEAAGRNNVLVQALLSRGINVAVTRKHGDRDTHAEFGNGMSSGMSNFGATGGASNGSVSPMYSGNDARLMRPGGGATATSGNFITAKRRGIVNGVDFAFTGDVVSVDVGSIYQRLAQGDVVLLSSLGFNAAGEVLNCQIYDVAVSIAIDIRADKLISYVATEEMPVDETGERAKYMPLSAAEKYVGGETGKTPEQWRGLDLSSPVFRTHNTASGMSPWRQLTNNNVQWRVSQAQQEVCAAVFVCKAGVRRAHLLDYTGTCRVSQVRHTARFTSNAGDCGGPITVTVVHTSSNTHTDYPSLLSTHRPIHA